jgi:predicted lipoprotein
MPLAEAVRDATARQKVETLYTESNTLKALFAGPLPQSLDIPLGFNSLDGD